MLDLDPDTQIRRAAFLKLDDLAVIHGPIFPWNAIDLGFSYGSQHYRFAAVPRGIFRPSGMRGGALSLKTRFTPAGQTPRYADAQTHDGYFIYRLQGSDPGAYDNQWLRTSFELKAPLIYFLGVAKGLYFPIYPVYVITIDSGNMSCVLEADAIPGHRGGVEYAQQAWEGARRYATAEVRRRLHQAQFRHHVVSAYAERCSICSLPRPELLDAAHIVPDSEESSQVLVSNGLSLCQLHHRAFDRDLLGIRPDGIVELTRDMLETRDGPTFESAFRRIHGEKISLPRREIDRPNAVFLEARYERFRARERSQ